MAPLARYTVLSMAYNDYDTSGNNFWIDRFLKCQVCQTNTKLNTRCPFGIGGIPPTWTFGNGTVVDLNNDLMEIGGKLQSLF